MRLPIKDLELLDRCRAKTRGEGQMISGDLSRLLELTDRVTLVAVQVTAMNEQTINQLMRECTYRGVFIVWCIASLAQIWLNVAADGLLGGNTAVLSLSWWVWALMAGSAAGVLWTGHRSRRWRALVEHEAELIRMAAFIAADPAPGTKDFRRMQRLGVTIAANERKICGGN